MHQLSGETVSGSQPGSVSGDIGSWNTPALARRKEPEVPAIDQIKINDNGTSKTLTPAEWKAIPVVERVRLLRGLATFFAGGVEVPAKAALAELK